MKVGEYRKFILLVRIYNSYFCRRTRDFEPLVKPRYDKVTLKDIKDYLEYPSNSSGLNFLFDKWIKNKIMIKSGKRFRNSKTKSKIDTYYFDGDRIEEYLKRRFNKFIKEIKRVI